MRGQAENLSDSVLIDNHVNSLNVNERLTLLYYLLFVHDKSLPNSYEWFRRPGYNPECISEAKETRHYGKAFAKFRQSISSKHKGLLNKCFTQQNNAGYTSIASLNKTNSVLKELIKNVQTRKRKFIKETINVDIYSAVSSRLRRNLQIPLDPAAYTGRLQHDSYSYDTNDYNAFYIVPVSLLTKLDENLPICQKRFQLPVRQQLSCPIAPRLANDLLFLISEEYNRTYDHYRGTILIWSAVLLILWLLLSTPLTRIRTLIVLVVAFAAFFFICVLYLERAGALAAVCREVNKTTGNFGLYFSSAFVRLSIGLQITFYKVDNVLTARDLIFLAGGLAFLQKFEQWESTTTMRPIYAYFGLWTTSSSVNQKQFNSDKKIQSDTLY